MSWMVGIFQAALGWSVERKMTLMLFVCIVAFPLAALIVLHSLGAQAAMNFLVGFLVASIILLVPFAKLMSHVTALRSIKDINAQCQLLKQGDYAHVELPSDRMEGNDFTMLKRNMHWMGYAIASRERKLSLAMTDLATAQRQIGESIDYASLIQTSFLPDIAELSEVFPDHFLIWNQRDTVGGDSYWYKPWGNGFFLGVIDCTGHGVPGAFMTLIVQALLEKAVLDCSGSPAQILGRMNRLIKDALGQNEKGAASDDGMDCVLCFVDPQARRLVFAGANSPLFLVDREGVRVVKGDRCGLGYVRSPRDFRFTDVEIELQEGIRIYMATDGIMDQVGGEKGFPFGKRRFMRFVQSGFLSGFDVQREALIQQLKEYQGNEDRRDDMTVLGFEI